MLNIGQNVQDSPRCPFAQATTAVEECDASKADSSTIIASHIITLSNLFNQNLNRLKFPFRGTGASFHSPLHHYE